MWLFLLSRLLLLRFANRQFLGLFQSFQSFQPPPRIARFEPVGHHPKSIHHTPPPQPTAGRQSERHQRLHRFYLTARNAENTARQSRNPKAPEAKAGESTAEE
jgi:hypothetical protein